MNKDQIRERFFLPGILFLMLVVIASSLYGLKTIFETSNHLAEEFLDRTTSSIQNDIEVFLYPALNANNFVEDYLAVEKQFVKNYDKLEEIGQQVLGRYPNLRSFNVGYPNGDFFMVKKNLDDSLSTKIIYRDNEEPYLIWKHYDEKGNLVNESKEEVDEYDPRDRPWYNGAINKKGIYWTPIYTLFTDQDLGITVGRPIVLSEESMGVISFDLKLQGVKDYISSLKISDHGEAVIVNYRDDILAFYTDNNDSTENVIRPKKINNVDDDVILEAYKYADQPIDQVYKFQVKGKNYYTQFTDLRSIYNDFWRIGIVVPETDFLQGYLVSRLITMFVIVIILILVFLLNYYRYSEKKVKGFLVKYSEQDPLTELRNRRSTIKLYEKIVNHQNKKYDYVSILLCDIDFFKKINDNYGHNCGDYVLVDLAKLMKDTFREEDIICRWGGEKFLIILRESNLEKARLAAEKLRQIVENRMVTFEFLEIKYTMSFGVAMTNKVMPLEQLVDEADKRLYVAKQTGRNKVVSDDVDHHSI